MGLQPLLSADWIADEENKRLLITVGVSMILHYGVLTIWQAPVASGSMSTSAVTVYLPELRGSPAPPAALTPSPPPVAPAAPPIPVAVKALQPPLALPPATTPAPAKVAALPSVSAVDQAPLPQSVVARRSDGVTVVLRVNAAGKVTQIFWNRLPAISNEQLDRLEQIVRTRQFVPNFSDRTVSEIIDVRALLSLPPAQSEATMLGDGVGATRSEHPATPSTPAPTGE